MLCKMGCVSDNTALRLLKITEFCMYFLVIVPIITLLYQAKGVSVGDFFLIQGLFAFVCFLFEIPSGYLADRFSRKKILLLGAGVSLVASLLLFFAYGFWMVAAAEMLLGVANALFSGTKEAYAYDLLKRVNRQDEFLKEYGSISTWGQAAGFIATVVGGLVYAAMGNGIILIEAAAYVIGIVCILLLPELHEVRRTDTNGKSPLADIVSIIKTSVRNPELKWLMMFPAMFGAFTLVMMWILQPVMQVCGVATALFGFFVGINQFSRVVYAKVSHRIYDRLGARRVMVLLVTLLMLAIFAVIVALNAHHMWLVYAMCVIIATVPACQKMSGLVFNTLVHHRIRSQERGTVLSLCSMYVTVFNGAMMMLMKPLIDGAGIMWTMVILMCMVVVLIIPGRQIWKMNIK